MEPLAEVLVLSGAPWRAQRIGRLLRVCGLRQRHVASLDEFRRALQPGKRQLLVLDETATTGPWRKVCGAARDAGAPVVAVMLKFDSRRWMELFKAGAFEVLCEPLPAARLRQAVEVAMEVRACRRGESSRWPGSGIVGALLAWIGR